jgi:hypothetical protein
MCKELGYNQEVWENSRASLNESEYSKVGIIGKSTIEMRFGSEDFHDGWNSVKEELGLETNPKASKYEEQEYIDNIKEESENGIAPKRDEISEPSGDSYHKVRGNLFNCYLDAVWLSGNEPNRSWFTNNKNYRDEISHILLNVVRENYWHQDPEIGNKQYKARIDSSSDYIIPTLEEIVEKSILASKVSIENELFPNLRQSHGRGLITRFDQDTFMELVGSYESGEKTNFNAWEDFLQQAEEKLDFNERQVKTLLNPNADPEDGGSFGRWMSQENMPRGAITFTSGSDQRPDYEVSSQ